MHEAKRALFNSVAELYDRVRPGYPPELFDDLIRLTGLPPGGRVLEIGCGTGQATVPLAGRGYHIVAVELGADMAEVARRKLARYRNVEVYTAAFEDWPLPNEPFDVVVAATAFHWVDPAVRYPKAAAALRPGGALAVFGSRHVAGGDQTFFDEAQDCYERYMPGTPPGLRLPTPDEIEPETAEIVASNLFRQPTLRRYIWEQMYSTDSYLDVLRTYSSHLELDLKARQSLLICIAGLMNSHYGGQIRKRYLTELVVAVRL